MANRNNILVVLGYPANADGSVGQILKARLDKAIELYNNGVAAMIILTGGAVNNQYVESDIMSGYLLQQGIPTTAILKEPTARNTYENARMVNAMMKKEGYNHAIVVTSSFHIMRARKFFHKEIGNVTVVPAPFPAGFSLLHRSVLLAKEYIIIALFDMGLLNGRYAIQR